MKHRYKHKNSRTVVELEDNVAASFPMWERTDEIPRCKESWEEPEPVIPFKEPESAISLAEPEPETPFKEPEFVTLTASATPIGNKPQRRIKRNDKESEENDG